MFKWNYVRGKELPASFGDDRFEWRFDCSLFPFLRLFYFYDAQTIVNLCTVINANLHASYRWIHKMNKFPRNFRFV